MSKFTVHQSGGRWNIRDSLGQNLGSTATEASANGLAMTFATVHGRNPLNDLPAELRSLAELFIQLLKGHKMPIDTSKLNASIAPFQAAVAAVIPLVESPAALTAAQADIDAATAANADATTKLNASVAAATTPPAA